jgi:hypothetical protein
MSRMLVVVAALWMSWGWSSDDRVEEPPSL